MSSLAQEVNQMRRLNVSPSAEASRKPGYRRVSPSLYSRCAGICIGKILRIISLVFLGSATAVSGQLPNESVAASTRKKETYFSTFSICAADPTTGEVGVAVTTRVPQVGRMVPWVRPGVGAVATQALTRVEFGEKGLELLEHGITPADALTELLKDDPSRDSRQIGIVSIAGANAAYTGNRCLPHSGSRTGKNYTVQGNLLAGKEVIDRCAEAFEKTEGAGILLADRLLDALEAGQKAGGDNRTGRLQSAALVVSDPRSPKVVGDSATLRLEVAEHAEPVDELRRQYETIFGRLGHRPLVLVRGNDVFELKKMLHALKLYKADAEVLPTPLQEPTIAVFDVETAEAVDKFRKSVGLAVPADGKGHQSGIVDREMVRLLKEKFVEVKRGKPAAGVAATPPSDSAKTNN